MTKNQSLIDINEDFSTTTCSKQGEIVPIVPCLVLRVQQLSSS